MKDRGTIIVGDLHGKVDIAEAALATPYNVVFIGDYLDSFEFKTDDHLRLLLIVLNAVESSPERVRALRGNHEMSYLIDGPGARCSGWRWDMQIHVNHHRERMEKYLGYWTMVDDYLISHAGVSQKLLTALGWTLDEYLTAGKFMDIGRSRGGSAPSGGLQWCDWYDDFESIPGQPQVVGHTAIRHSGDAKGVLSNGQDYNVDCLDRVPEVLLIKDGEASILKLVGTNECKLI